MIIVKFLKCLHIFSFAHLGIKFHPCFLTGMSSYRDEISSLQKLVNSNISFWQKRVNSKRHFMIDRDRFIPGRVSTLDEISRVNIL